MGEETKRNGQETGLSLEKYAEGTDGRSASTSSSETETRRVGRARGRGRGRTAEETKVDEKGILDVKEHESTGEEVPPPPPQGKPKPVELNVNDTTPEEKKVTSQAQRKTRKSRVKKNTVDMTQFDVMLLGFSDYIASRPNMSHWKMTEKEVKSITEPLGNMIAKSDFAGQIAEHSDAIALVIACGMVFVPRVTITVQQKSADKKAKKSGLISNKKGDKNEHIRTEEKADGDTAGANDSKRKHPNNVSPIYPDLSFLGSGLPTI